MLTILVPKPDPSHTVAIAWRPQGNPNFVPINPADPHLDMLDRTNHVLLRVDLTNLPEPTPMGSEWRVQRLDGGTPQPQIDADVLTMVDLHVQTEMFFGSDTHFVDEPIDLFCRIQAGGAAVTEAEVLVDVALPGEGLGTFLTTNASLYKKIKDNAQPDGRDPDTGKAHMISTLLHATEQQQLPIVAAPDFVLHDDGAHGDGAAGDGLWGNSFLETKKEGTYTFRFRVSGKLPDGSQFARTILKSIYLSLKPSITATIMNWATLDEPVTGLTVSVLTIIPKSESGEFLGPFQGATIASTVTDGQPDGDWVDNIDGSYTLRVLHPSDASPIVSVDIYGMPLRPTGPRVDDPSRGDPPTDDLSCMQLFHALMACIWRSIKQMFGMG